MTHTRKDANTTPLTVRDNDENEDDADAQEVVMRTELAIEIADTAQPTIEEIKEYESFTSKFITLIILPAKNFESDIDPIIQNIFRSLARKLKQE